MQRDKILQNPNFSQQKSRIRETKNLSTDADSSTDTKKSPASKAKLTKKQTLFCGAQQNKQMKKIF